MMIYLASPYSHKSADVMYNRYLTALRVTATLMRGGQHIFSPIVHCHHMAVQHAMPRDFEFWMKYDKHMIDISSGIIVLAIPGWQQSRGVTAELAYADEIVKAVSFIDREANEISEEQARCV